MSDDEDDVAIKYTLPEDVNGYLLFYVDESLAANTFSISEPGNYSLTLTDLLIDGRGEYYIEVQYLNMSASGENTNIANGTLKVVKDYDVTDFNIYWNSKANSIFENILVFSGFPMKGNLIVYVDGQKRYNNTINDLDKIIRFDVNSLNITSNGNFVVSAKYVTNESQEFFLGNSTVKVDVEWVTDEYLSIFSDIDILNKFEDVIALEDSYGFLNGTLTVYIDGAPKLTKKIKASEKEDLILLTSMI